MMKKAAIFFLFLCFLAGYLHAQSTEEIFTRIQKNKPGQGTVRITQHADIRNLVNIHVAQQRSINGINGFKISIYRGSGAEARKESEMIESRFLSKYENVKCERKVEYPDWKVYVGAFRTKSEALMFLKRIEYDYPDAFIRADIIPFPD